MRIGIYGGTFNPVHNGHKFVIDAVRTQFQMDKIFIVPSAVPPHKTKKNLADITYRLKMLEIVFRNYKFYEISDIESKRIGPSYTIDTIKYFYSLFTDKDIIFLVLGIDAFLEITTWHQWENIFKKTQMVVINRPFNNNVNKVNIKTLVEKFLNKNFSGYFYRETDNSFNHLINKKIYLFNIPNRKESSSEIRKKISSKKKWTDLVHDEVADFIKLKGLYK